MNKATFKELADQMVELQAKKNHDYGNAFAKSCDEFGLVSAAIRLTDKLNRFKSLIKEEAHVKAEGIEDTLVDMAAYSLMAVEWIKNNTQSQEITHRIYKTSGEKDD